MQHEPMANETALREALALAANRLARCALDQEMFTEKYYQVAEWGEEARAAAQSPSQPVVAEAGPFAWMLREIGTGKVFWDDEHCIWTHKPDAEEAAEEMGDHEVFGVFAYPQASPPPVQGEVTQADEIFCDAVWHALKGDHNDLRKQQIILKAHRLAHSQPDTQEGEAERRGEKRAIARIVSVSRAIGSQAGVGGRETAGAIVSYLATSPDEIAPFVAGELSPLDFAGDLMRGGCLTWHAMNGKVVSPEDVAAALQQQEQQP